MLRVFDNSVRLCDGISRREWLRIGGIGLGGLTLPSLWRAQAQAATNGEPGFGRAKSVIVLFFSGGVPQHETWDPKPNAPAEVRGDIGVIASRTPGLQVGELMPKTALLTDKIAVLRTMVTGDNAHSTSGYQMLTGVPHAPLNRENALPGKPNDWPSLDALVRALRPTQGGLPQSITLPRILANVGDKEWPGQGGGLLGRQYDPWALTCDPSAKDFTIPGCGMAEDVTPMRFDRRRSLLAQFNRHLDEVQRGQRVQRFDTHASQALELLTGGRARAAFDLGQESEATRERYGQDQFGQSVLLARRLVEAGVSLVHINWPRMDEKKNNGSWDTHAAHSECLKGWLMPMMDRSYSALIEDLEARGMLDETLVCWVGEFGHTPKINGNAGRDHWGRVFSIALAGGGIQGGAVLGETDRLAGEPLTEAIRPCDYLATVFHCMGYAPDTIVHDLENRPLPISRGRVLTEILRQA
ncbi:MAG: DUF1501 domain-containing protein [Planctomycetales bacterium]|nr:DUF1501 domain-containing protein [Planctomycetales bacterium]